MMLLKEAVKQISIPISFRVATETDLPKLEWYGQYTHFRRVFERTYREQGTGARLILVADINGFPIGQVFILLRIARKHRRFLDESQAYFYSLRVIEHLQGLGIGTSLLQCAEGIVERRGYTWALISAAKTNPRARQLYERLGYRVYSEDEGRWQYINHLGQTVQMHEPCWMLEKKLKNV